MQNWHFLGTIFGRLYQIHINKLYPIIPKLYQNTKIIPKLYQIIPNLHQFGTCMQNWDFFGTKFGLWSHLGPSPKFGTSLEGLHLCLCEYITCKFKLWSACYLRASQILQLTWKSVGRPNPSRGDNFFQGPLASKNFCLCPPPTWLPQSLLIFQTWAFFS